MIDKFRNCSYLPPIRELNGVLLCLTIRFKVLDLAEYVCGWAVLGQHGEGDDYSPSAHMHTHTLDQIQTPNLDFIA